jgi:hypothetical protein
MHFTAPQFEFYSRVAIPTANIERLILKRDKFGRIVASKVPVIYNRYV